ncbi:MAG: single-stranded-DNA-specific exonuclease RecJ [Lachnospiraceae bacterium]|nr:single-stranded-DNA-specific exonuclease RecJ [Lachnospiraceae bacterium]
MSDWVLIRKGGDYAAVGKAHGISPVVARLLKNRGVSEDEEIERYLHGGMECLHDPALLDGIDELSAILLDAIDSGKKIRVIGDYDIDGVCASTILVKGIKFLGGDVDARIPHRVRDGYGMNCDMIKQAKDDGIDLIITCDNGIAAREEALLAKELGITLLITDHHEIPYEETDGERHYLIPDAAAVIDPHLPGSEYPFPGICGGFVAYKLIRYCCDKASVSTDPLLDAELVQYAAFATVGDIMELRDENRVLVKQGLKLMNEDPAGGIRELISVLDLGNKEIAAYHLGFMLGPCINATGRIDTALRAFELMTTEDRTEAMRLAGELKELNESRKTMTEQATAAAVEQIESGEHDSCKVYVIYLPECHESIAGIVAGRIRERYFHPTLIVTNGEEGLKGSARSIPAYHMYDALTAVADIFTRFGGHSQAAGFSLPADKLNDLRRRLNENCSLKEEDFSEKVTIDLELPLKYATMGLVQELKCLEPCGNGNTRAVIARGGLRLRSISPAGREGKLCILNVEDEGTAYELKAFFKTDAIKSYIEEKYGAEVLKALLAGKGEGVGFSVIYKPDINEYNGRTNLQLIMEDYK